MGFLTPHKLHKATRIEDVVDWKKVVYKYLQSYNDEAMFVDLIGCQPAEAFAMETDWSVKDNAG